MFRQTTLGLMSKNTCSYGRGNTVCDTPASRDAEVSQTVFPQQSMERETTY
ncbi:MAG: hypothetical protein V3U88_07760 [Methylococcales bacterium]